MRTGTACEQSAGLRDRAGSENPISLARTFAVPAGRTPKANFRDPAIPLTTSLMVPSPPAARIRSQPSSTALRSKFTGSLRTGRCEKLDFAARHPGEYEQPYPDARVRPFQSAGKRVEDESDTMG